jgi:hypothetical protein
MGLITARGDVVPGPGDFALLHEREMPQKDQLCGAFWGALTLSAAGYRTSQEEVALLAGTTLAKGDPAEWLPPGAAPRNDYTSDLPLTPDGASAGTSAAGVARGIEELSGGALSVIPVAGPWTEEKVAPLIDTASESAPECVLIANLRTGRLWGSHASSRLLLDHLAGRTVEPPPPDWDCGHFLLPPAASRGHGGGSRAGRRARRRGALRLRRQGRGGPRHSAGRGGLRAATLGQRFARPRRRWEWCGVKI